MAGFLDFLRMRLGWWSSPPPPPPAVVVCHHVAFRRKAEFAVASHRVEAFAVACRRVVTHRIDRDPEC
jgi:hypothetical protein